MGCLGWKYQLFCLLVLLSLLFHLPSSFSSSLSSISPCSALLHFNHSLSLDQSASPSFYTYRIQMCDNSYPKTASWKEDKDCCSWDGVVCDQTTRHVIGLDLSCSWLSGPIHSNSTLFFLPHLRTLNLAGNCFESLISSEFGNFKTLTHLNLSYSCFSGKIPNEISHLSSLVSLDLSLNDGLLIETPVWKRVIHNLTQLRELLLDWSDMSSIRPNSLMNLSSSFTTISLHGCNLQGKLQNNFRCLPNIQTLDLGENWNLDLGSLPKCNWSSISLKFLDVSSISFSRKLPDFIGNMKSLKHLNLANCNLTGSISTSLGNLVKLTILDLSYNSFSGLLPLSLFNLLNLSSLYLDNNQLVGHLPNQVSGLLNLKDLYLSSNFLKGTLPSWLFNLPSLVTLNLDGNQFIGEIGEFKSNSLEHLDLGYNKLQGSIPRSISRFVNLTYLSLSSNNWSVMLELEMFSKLKNLEFLDFSNNLVSINNNVTYTLPNLQQLNLSSCNISEFPIFLRTTTTLKFLDLSKNRIYGQVPRWLGDVGRDSLYFLDLRGNLLQGPFPTLSLLSLQYLFVSNNKLTGEIPSLICNESSLVVLDLSHNNLSGVVPKCLLHSNVLLVLDLRMNSLRGTIPATFAKRNNFRIINLNGNQLEGPLPQSLANCSLEWLDLSFNKLIGEIPRQLADLPWLEVLNLSHNQLTGHIPSGKQFNTFDNDSYAENQGLCGFPLSKTCNSPEAKKPPPLTLQQEENIEPQNGFSWQAISMGYGCGVIFGMLMGYLMFKIGKSKWIVRMEKINFFHGPQRHRTPFFAKLVGIVAVEVIVRFKAVASNVSEHISNRCALEQIKTSTANTKFNY
ncbi:hypothetical protein CMV_022592 [Castanea mollissima]|uniref:Leucine-rich repeat-containing N-terminal plant-type domain-containing protein n=1 Tax=Castanea mollissima TaxID=60419 RepID=A0A8J4QS60_9ROSI|nr:hypothetical protein CMV_022592 [Castanea mollissima]